MLKRFCSHVAVLYRLYLVREYSSDVNITRLHTSSNVPAFVDVPAFDPWEGAGGSGGLALIPDFLIPSSYFLLHTVHLEATTD
jgi:hypothetical protein